MNKTNFTRLSYTDWQSFLPTRLAIQIRKDIIHNVEYSEKNKQQINIEGGDFQWEGHNGGEDEIERICDDGVVRLRESVKSENGKVEKRRWGSNMVNG